MKIKHWQDPVSLFAGVWLAVSPWVLGYSAHMRATENAVIAGSLIALVALSALYRGSAWQEWTNFVLGVWVLISPWALVFPVMKPVTLNAVVYGVIVAALAYWVLATDHDIGGSLGPAH